MTDNLQCERAARIRDGDRVRIDAVSGRLEVLVDAETWGLREPSLYRPGVDTDDTGRILFAGLRATVSTAATGATIFSALAALPEAGSAN